MSGRTRRHMEGQPAQDAQSQKPQPKRPPLKIWPPTDSKWPPFPDPALDATTWEPTEEDDGSEPSILPFVAAESPQWIRLYSGFGRLIGRFLHREDALAAFVFWEQAAFAICGSEVIARRTTNTVQFSAGRVAA